MFHHIFLYNIDYRLPCRDFIADLLSILLELYTFYLQSIIEICNYILYVIVGKGLIGIFLLILDEIFDLFCGLHLWLFWRFKDVEWNFIFLLRNYWMIVYNNFTYGIWLLWYLWTNLMDDFCWKGVCLFTIESFLLRNILNVQFLE